MFKIYHHHFLNNLEKTCMRKSPKESATQYKLGTKKAGLDGFYYYVLKDKNSRKRWSKIGCLFVIYKLTNSKKVNIWEAIENAKISYPDRKFPNDWKYVGGGTTVFIQHLDDSVEYPMEEQFMGHPKYTAKMRDKLNDYLKKLKRKNIIKKYRIVGEKGLRNYMSKVSK